MDAPILQKPVTTSSSVGDHLPGLLTDEKVKTYWLAESNDTGEWVIIDLVQPCRVYAIQINYFDHQSDMYGKIPGLKHRYTIEGSPDGRNWHTLINKSNSYRDTPNDYVELPQPEKFAISGIQT